MLDARNPRLALSMQVRRAMLLGLGVTASALLVTGCTDNATTPVTVTSTATIRTTLPAPPTVTLILETTLSAPAQETVTDTLTLTVTAPGQPLGDTFDRTKLEAGVLKILTSLPPDGYGTTGITSLTCPPDQPVIAGATFDCVAAINEARKTVTITVKDSSGTYEVGVPQ